MTIALPTKKSKVEMGLENYTTLIYGPSKIGKSTWCSQAGGALFLATEPGLNHLEVFSVGVQSWQALLDACALLAKGDHEFKTIILDTIDNAYKMCSEHICGKTKVLHESDLGYGKGYALVNNEFQRVLNKLAFLPYGLILVSHSQEKDVDTRVGKVTKIVPTLPNKAREIVMGLVDVILFCDLEEVVDPDGKASYRRVVRTKPNRNYDAGDRTGKLPETLPLEYKAFADAFEAASRKERAQAPPKSDTSTSTKASGEKRKGEPAA